MSGVCISQAICVSYMAGPTQKWDDKLRNDRHDKDWLISISMTLEYNEEACPAHHLVLHMMKGIATWQDGCQLDLQSPQVQLCMAAATPGDAL